MTNRRYCLLVLAIAMLVVAPCTAVRGQDKQDHRLTIKSAVLGEERVVLVRTPAGYETGDQRYPVLYMTDAPDHLGHAASSIEFLASARNGRMPQMIVVAIVNTDRTRDLTPTKASMDPAGKQPPVGGGADNFLKFIETELIPLVEKTYRTQPYRVFAGHSFGGLLVMHAFATKNELFNAYLASSPSLDWDKEIAIQKTREFLEGRKELNRTLFMCLSNEKGGMRSSFDKAKELLAHQQIKGFVWDSMLMEDEDHGSVVLRSYYSGLKKIFEGWNPTQETRAAGVAALEEHFKKLSAKYGYTILVPEFMINEAGYQLLRDGKNDAAIAVFKTNVERYPNSANVYDSLAEAYEKTGKLDLAKPNCERAVQLAIKNHDVNLALFRTNLERVSKALEGKGKTPEK
jgi:uncharacterized protein